MSFEEELLRLREQERIKKERARIESEGQESKRRAAEEEQENRSRTLELLAKDRIRPLLERANKTYLDNKGEITSHGSNGYQLDWDRGGGTNFKTDYRYGKRITIFIRFRQAKKHLFSRVQESLFVSVFGGANSEHKTFDLNKPGAQQRLEKAILYLLSKPDRCRWLEETNYDYM